MKIKELVLMMNRDKNKLMKAEQKQELIKRELNVQEYLSIKAKKTLVQDIVDECILYDDGVFKFDDIEKYICFIMRTIAAYTNIELSEDIEDDYDALCKAKLLDVIINTFQKEYDEINILLQMKCDYILNNNNIEVQVGKFLTALSEKLDILSDVLMNKVDGFTLDKLPIDQADLGKVLEFVNKYQK